MWYARVLLHLVALLAWSRDVFSQGFAPPEEPVCAVRCCGPPVEIPVEQTFQMFIIPFETEEQTVLSNSITKAEALSNLSQDFLQPETIEDLARFATDFYQVDFVSLIPFGGSRCDLPLSKACMVQRCGCNSQTGRRLLQCLPVFGCSQSTSGALEDADFDGVIQLPPPMLFGICLMGSCTLFQIKSSNANVFNFALTATCPDVVPVISQITALTPSPTSTQSSLILDSPPPPPPSPTTTTTTLSGSGATVTTTTTTGSGSSDPTQEAIFPEESPSESSTPGSRKKPHPRRPLPPPGVPARGRIRPGQRNPFWPFTG